MGLALATSERISSLTVRNASVPGAVVSNWLVTWLKFMWNAELQKAEVVGRAWAFGQ